MLQWLYIHIVYPLRTKYERNFVVELLGPKVIVYLPNTLQKVCPTLHSYQQCMTVSIFYLHSYLCTLGIFNYLKSWKMVTWLYLRFKKLLLILNILVSLKKNNNKQFFHVLCSFSYWYSSFLLTYTSPLYMKSLSYKQFFP